MMDEENFPRGRAYDKQQPISGDKARGEQHPLADLCKCGHPVVHHHPSFKDFDGGCIDCPCHDYPAAPNTPVPRRASNGTILDTKSAANEGGKANDGKQETDIVKIEPNRAKRVRGGVTWR